VTCEWQRENTQPERPQINGSPIEELGKTVHNIKAEDYKAAGPILRKMFRCRGIALPMASTILRFLNPDSFQIIDDRVYRIVRPGQAKYTTKPPKPNTAYLDTSVNIYFDCPCPPAGGFASGRHCGAYRRGRLASADGSS
jgi:hypothetical protein